MFKIGDYVKDLKNPEWGIGVVVWVRDNPGAPRTDVFFSDKEQWIKDGLIDGSSYCTYADAHIGRVADLIKLPVLVFDNDFSKPEDGASYLLVRHEILDNGVWGCDAPNEVFISHYTERTTSFKDVQFFARIG